MDSWIKDLTVLLSFGFSLCSVYIFGLFVVCLFFWFGQQWRECFDSQNSRNLILKIKRDMNIEEQKRGKINIDGRSSPKKGRQGDDRLKEVIRCSLCDMRFSSSGSRIKLNERIFQMFIHFHDCCLVTASVAIIRG